MKTINFLFSEIFGVPEKEITDDLSLMDFDSFKLIFFFSQIEKEYGMKFMLKDMVNVNNLGELKGILKKMEAR